MQARMGIDQLLLVLQEGGNRTCSSTSVCILYTHFLRGEGCIVTYHKIRKGQLIDLG